jgi:hypothetical protein
MLDGLRWGGRSRACGRPARSAVRRALRLGVLGLLAGCAAMESVPPERRAELEARAKACGEALPTISRYDVDHFGRVSATAQGAEADVIERNFMDCVFTRGRWGSWVAGQPAPMLEPLGPDNPDPSPALRIP